MNQGHDEEKLESVAVLALGALPAGEARAIVEHMATCDICRREYAELRPVADLVGHAAGVPDANADQLRAARLKARILDQIRATLPADGSGAEPRAPRPSAQRRAAHTWLPYAAAVAAIVVAGVSVSDNATLRAGNAARDARIAALQARGNAQSSAAASAGARVRTLDARVAALLAPGGKHYAVPGGEIVVGGGRVFIALRELRPLPAGKVYQAWTLARGAKTVAPSLTFSPDASGVAVVEIPGSAQTLSAVAVSVEPAGGSRAPTSKPAFLRPLS